MVDGWLWLDATGGSKKEKVIGFGNGLNKNLVLYSCASSFVPSSRLSTQESNSDCTSCGAFQAQVRDELREFQSMFQEFMISIRALSPNSPSCSWESVSHATRHQQDEDEAFNENTGRLLKYSCINDLDGKDMMYVTDLVLNMIEYNYINDLDGKNIMYVMDLVLNIIY